MIEVHALTKTYPGNTARAVDRVSFVVEAGRIFTLLGPSGCGKTTTLRSIAGLERPDEGMIRLFEDVVYASELKRFVPPSKRGVGMVFQSYAIWPHMTVFQNVAYPLKGKGLSRDAMRKRALEALQMVNLDGYEDRPAPRLSGGQQQRVALARAIASDPRIFLFDEPLSNLDAKLRQEMRGQIRALQRKLGITSLYVTHDQIEALSISDKIAIMDNGRIVETGSPRDIYLYPKSRFAAQFIGQTNMVPATVLGRDGGETLVLETPLGNLRHKLDGRMVYEAGASVLLLLRPEQIALLPSSTDGSENTWQGVVVASEFLGEATELMVACGSLTLRTRTNSFAYFEEGVAVQLKIAPEHFTVIPD